MNVFAIRHGETAWSLSGQHTGVSDIPLTDQGRLLARELCPVLAKEAFALVLVSPLQRARETCTLAGLGDTATVEQDLMEWNYGEYEGLTPLQIKSTAPDWLLFRDGCAGGEMPDEVGRRVDRVISRVRVADGNVALFAHGHVLRVLAARWIGLPAAGGQHFLLDTGTVCVLGYYRSAPAIRIWNAPPASLAAISNRVEPERTRCEPALEAHGSAPQRAAPAPLVQERVQRR
jgi:probable phosphoglycerate mutase